MGTLARFERHEFQVEDFCKTETLSESLASYRQKVEEGKRNPSALYELALKAGRDYRAGDPLSFYVIGTRKNVTVYESCKLASQWDSTIRMKTWLTTNPSLKSCMTSSGPTFLTQSRRCREC